MRKQRRLQVREIAIRVARRGNAFVDLHNLHLPPRHFFIGQQPQHLPRRAPAADGHHKLPARANSGARFRRDDCCGFAHYSVGVGENFDLHQCLVSLRSHNRVQPTAGRGNRLFFRPPRSGVVFKNRRAGL